MNVRLRVVAVTAVLVLSSAAASAYLSLGSNVNGRNVTLRWTVLPIRYFITNRSIPNVTAPQLQAAAAASFAAWSAVPTASVSSSFAGFTNLEPVREDGATVIGFQPHDELDRTLGVTSFTVDTTTGTLVEADIFLNSAFAWSTAPGGETNKFDVQSVLTHEVGHLHGLGHSLLGETVPRADGGRKVIAKRAVMFPIAFTAGTTLDRTLQDDDKAAIAATYPTSAFLNELGSVSGKVTLNGAGVFGAHVTATNTSTGDIVGAFALNHDGQFVIDGLTPGIYVLRAEPIDDADVGSFFSDVSAVNVNFKATFLSKLVAVPRGGAGAAVEIKVTPK